MEDSIREASPVFLYLVCYRRTMNVFMLNMMTMTEEESPWNISV